ncbi:MAG: rfbG [Herbinix sp.]|jgi:CDP-glucose 4,6-dehydratase|nr:rfbG [Herbinix sp.]
MDNNFWQGKKVLITGHTGFKGSWLSIWLHEMGAEVIGYALEPYSELDNYVLSGIGEKIIDIRGDIRDIKHLHEVFIQYHPEIVFHMAAQPLVRESYLNPRDTYETNVMGTMNVLECIRNTSETRIGIMITTDKCYENKEQIWGYRESDRFGGYDPYSSSKACAEILISSYRNSFFNTKEYNIHGKAIASVRAGNVIGGGDWAKDRIIPDCIRAIEQDEPIKIRCPHAVRPWEHVLEPLSGYILLAEKLFNQPTEFSEGWNFGPEYNAFLSVWEVAKQLTQAYGKGTLIDTSDCKEPHEANLLFLDITKAKQRLGWQPRLTIEDTMELTIDWYKRYRKTNVYELCKKQINFYTKRTL